MAPSKTVPQTPYKIWHGKPASYKYLRVWGSSAYVKSLMGHKLDSRFCLCRFIGYSKKLRDTTSMIDLSKRHLSQGTQYSWKRVSLWITDKMRCYLRSRVNHLSKTTQHHLNLLFLLMVFQFPISTRESQPPERYGFVGLTSQLDNDPNTYREAMSDIDSDKWLEV
ncbi:UNVERIFIED_CONTAM: hypothetical protein Sradi_4125800 [Sesamum radiatum]|uniref:Uncharacterized protein n=1 Tax=Sesamum radiatum TaxID=300843 RepID=A0AAW2P4T8_SESRA